MLRPIESTNLSRGGAKNPIERKVVGVSFVSEANDTIVQRVDTNHLGRARRSPIVRENGTRPAKYADVPYERNRVRHLNQNALPLQSHSFHTIRLIR